MAQQPVRAGKKRVRRDPRQARQHILDAAVRVISRHGPSACGLKDVAEEAGTSHALVTHYFGSYAALVEATLDEAVSRVQERLVARLMALPNPTPARLVDLYLEIALEPWYGRLLSWAIFNDRDATSMYAKRILPQMKLMAAQTREVLGQRLQPPPSAELSEAMLVSVWAMVVGYVAGNEFFWRSLGRKPGPRTHQALREAVALLASRLG